MRVTSFHLIAQEAAATSAAQQRVADASQVAASGLSVAVPSDNVTAWVEAAKDRVRQAISSGGGDAIQTGLDQLQQTDGALSTIASVLSSAKSLAVQGASSGLTAGDRQDLAAEATGLFQTALTAANTQGPDNTFLLGGSADETAPFDASGNFSGNATTQQIASDSSGDRLGVSLSGDVLTAANGVDVLPALQQLATALASNNTTGIQTSITTLSTAVNQVADARAQGGVAQSALNSASTAAQQLQTQLQNNAAGLVQADAVTAASNLAQATQALDVAEAASEHVIAALTPASE